VEKRSVECDDEASMSCVTSIHNQSYRPCRRNTTTFYIQILFLHFVNRMSRRSATISKIFMHRLTSAASRDATGMSCWLRDATSCPTRSLVAVTSVHASSFMHGSPRGVRSFSTSGNSNGGEPPKADAREETLSSATEETSTETQEEQKRLSEEVMKLEGEIKTMKDQLLRSYAEQENTRAIAKRDVSEARQFAIKSFAKSLLEVSDNLQRALDSVPASDVEANPQLKTLYEGVQMTNTGLLKAFAGNGLKKYCEVPGDKFDPSLHSALMQYPDPSKEPNTVGQVISVGFTLNDRVLRPAEVGVIQSR